MSVFKTFSILFSIIVSTSLLVRCEDILEESNLDSNQSNSALVKGIQTKIVGGVPVIDRSKFAYQVSLTSHGNHFCGGSILDKRNVLTAAHCVQGINARELTVVVGHLKHTQSDRVRVAVSNIFSHESYSEKTIDNDIAILRLKSNLTMNINIQPIDVTTSRPDDNSLCTVSGWGVLSEASTTVSPILMEVDLFTVGQQACKSVYLNLTQNMLCAANYRKDSCSGDSGGPLVMGNKLIGIVSYGVGCARPQFPGVYTDVSRYEVWIKTQLSRSSAGVSALNIILILLSIFQIYQNYMTKYL